MSQIWKLCLIRRSIQFRINEKKIDNDISSVQAVILNCKHTEEKIVSHAMIHEKLIIALLKLDKSKNIENSKTTLKERKKKFSLKSYRKLQLISMSLQLNQIDEKFDLRAKNVKQILKDDNYHED